MLNQVNQEAAGEAIKATPPVVFTAAWLHGLSISDVVALATLAYVLLQIGLLLPKYYKLVRKCRQK